MSRLCVLADASPRALVLVCSTSAGAISLAVAGLPLGVRGPPAAPAAPLVGIANVVQTIPSPPCSGSCPVPSWRRRRTRRDRGAHSRPAADRADDDRRARDGPSIRRGRRGWDDAARAVPARGCRWRCRQIVAAFAVAAGVGSATIAAAIGAGGLGEYIGRGLSMVDDGHPGGATPPLALESTGDRWAETASPPHPVASCRHTKTPPF